MHSGETRSNPLNAAATPSLARRILDLPLWRMRSGESAITVENIPYLLFHLLPLGVFFVEFSWGAVALCAGLYFARMFAITGFYHRYFSHRGYTVNSRITQFLMGLWGCTAVQQGPLWWAAHHRWHHRYSDTEQDLHSPLRQGFWYSHTGWFLDLKHHDEFSGGQQHPKDLARYPELVWLERFSLLVPILFGAAIYLWGGWSYFFWGFGLSTVLLWHGTFTINSLSHMLGSRRFDTADTSRNNFWLALITLGEGWHNNHHAHAGGAKAGFYWYEIDITYYLLRVMQFCGLISNLGAPPERVLERGRENDRLRKQARRVLKGSIVRRLRADEIELALEAVGCCIDRRDMRRLRLPEIRQYIDRFRAAKERLMTLDDGLQPGAV